MAGDYRDSFWVCADICAECLKQGHNTVFWQNCFVINIMCVQGGSLEGFEVAAAASKRGWSAFKELAESLQGRYYSPELCIACGHLANIYLYIYTIYIWCYICSRTAMEEHVKEGQRMSRDHMVKDAGYV